MGTGGNFDDKLDLFKDPITEEVSVVAKGPAYGEDVVHIGVWIIQKQPEGDAAATQITTVTGRPGFQTSTRPSETPGEKPEKIWELRALQASKLKLQDGNAIAMAIALFLEDGKQQARFWAQSVELELKK
jgi:hypothetical protein